MAKHAPVEREQAGRVDLLVEVGTVRLDQEGLAHQQPDDAARHPVDVDDVVTAASKPEDAGQVEQQPQRERDGFRQPRPVGPEVGEPDVIDLVTAAAKDARLDVRDPGDVVHQGNSSHG